MKLRHTIVLILFILINASIIYILIQLIPKKEKETVELETVLPYVTATEIRNSDQQFDIRAFGTVSAFRSVDIACEVQGRLTEGTSLKPGVKFRAGELLFRIDDTEARYTLRSRKSSFINLIAGILPDIKTDYNSEFDKWQGYLESIKLDENLAGLPSWKSEKEKIFLSTRNVLTEYFAIKSLEEQLKEYYVFAPFTGMISEVFLSDFSVVNPGVKVARLVETGNYEIPVSIPMSRLHLVEVGTLAELLATDGVIRGAGKVTRISQVINQLTQSVDVFVKPIMASGDAYFEGEYLEVRIDEKGMYNGFRLPPGAVNSGEVYVYNPRDSTLSAQKVTVIDKDEAGVFVSGLKDKQIVITQTVDGHKVDSKYGIVLEK